jgi:protease I
MANQRVIFLLGQGFEDQEFRAPYDRLSAAGFPVDVVGAGRGDVLTGYRGKEAVRVDRGIDEAEPEDYAALVIPGGQSPDHLRADHRFVDFVRAFDRTGKPLAAVCHGPQLLITAGLVRGRTLTAWTTIQGDLRQIGANVKDEAVVRDGNWITSRNPGDLEAFSAAVIQALHGSAADARASAAGEAAEEELPGQAARRVPDQQRGMRAGAKDEGGGRSRG